MQEQDGLERKHALRGYTPKSLVLDIGRSSNQDDGQEKNSGRSGRRNQGLDFRERAADVGRVPVDPGASRTAGEFVVAGEYEGWHATHDQVAIEPLQQLVARRASCKRVGARIEGPARQHLAQLFAEEI